MVSFDPNRRSYKDALLSGSSGASQRLSGADCSSGGAEGSGLLKAHDIRDLRLSALNDANWQSVPINTFELILDKLCEIKEEGCTNKETFSNLRLVCCGWSEMLAILIATRYGVFLTSEGSQSLIADASVTSIVKFISLGLKCVYAPVRFDEEVRSSLLALFKQHSIALRFHSVEFPTNMEDAEMEKVCGQEDYNICDASSFSFYNCSKLTKAGFGYIGEKLSFSSELMKVDFTGTSIRKEDLSFLGSCKNISFLTFDACYELEGLPESIFSLEKLSYISFNGCYNLDTKSFKFTGQEDFFCRGLEKIDFSGTKIEKEDLQFWGDCPKLSSLVFQNCDLLEGLPGEIFKSLTSLFLIKCDKITVGEMGRIHDFGRNQLIDLRLSVCPRVSREHLKGLKEYGSQLKTLYLSTCEEKFNTEDLKVLQGMKGLEEYGIAFTGSKSKLHERPKLGCLSESYLYHDRHGGRESASEYYLLSSNDDLESDRYDLTSAIYYCGL